VSRAQRWGYYLGMASAAAVTVLVAATAFVLAYGGSRGAAQDAGISVAASAAYPLCIEGAVVVASIGTIVVGGWYPWSVLGAFTAVSVGANVLHALDHPGHSGWSLLFAAIPPATLPVCAEMTIRVVRAAASAVGRTAGPAAPVETATTPAAAVPVAEGRHAADDPAPAPVQPAPATHGVVAETKTQRAARIAAEHGPGNLTANALADLAGVSVRTAGDALRAARRAAA
jgi:hypothetical protein